jgi:hypothetical protein
VRDRHHQVAGLPSTSVTWEKATRTVSLADPATAWTDLLAEIDGLSPDERFAVVVDDRADRAVRADRVGSLICRGYSVGLDPAGVLVPQPSGVLSIVAPWDADDDVSASLSDVSSAHFRRYLLAMHTSEEQFARLASLGLVESWHLDPFLPQRAWAEFIVEFVGSRQIDLVQVVNARFGVDLIPALRAAYPSSRVVVDAGGDTTPANVWLTYVTSRYGNVVDAFCVSHVDQVPGLEKEYVSPTRIHVVGAGVDGHGAAAVSARERLYGRLIASRTG